MNEDLEKALRLIEAERFSEALPLLATAREIATSSFERCVIALNESKCFMLLGRFREARKMLDYVTNLDRDGSLRLYVEFASINLMYAEQKTAEALEKSRSFLGANQEQLQQEEYVDMVYDLRLRSACEAVTAGRFQSGIEDLRRFMNTARDEDRSRIHLFLGIAFEQLANYKEAINEFEQVLHSPDQRDLTAEAHYRLGAVHFNVGAFAWARQHFTEAESSIDSLKNISASDLYTFLAQTHGHLGDEAERQRYIALSGGKTGDR
jgi:tetratricopeptide (TPR) repeat protein